MFGWCRLAGWFGLGWANQPSRSAAHVIEQAERHCSGPAQPFFSKPNMLNFVMAQMACGEKNWGFCLDFSYLCPIALLLFAVAQINFTD